MLLAYALGTAAMTWPLVTVLGQAIPGDGFDGWQNYWNLWWVKKALLDLHQNPFYSDVIFYPTGVDLYFHTLNIFNGLVSLPVQGVGNLFWAYNFIVFLAFALGGYGAYLLTRYVLGWVGLGKGPGREWAAFLSGCTFTFSPFHFAHLLGHMQVFSLEWIPFYVLAFLRATEPRQDRVRQQGEGTATKPWRRAVRPALFLILVGLCDWYYVMYLGFFSLLYLAYLAGARRLRWDTLQTSVGIAVLFGVVLSPILVPMVVTAQRETFMVPDPSQARALSADLLAFVTPSEFHPLWGKAVRPLAERFTTSTSERTVFAGFTVLALAFLGLLRRPRGLGFWWLSLLTFGLLALGPVLHVAGETRLGPGGWEIPLPYRLLHGLVPFMRITRSVSRFDAMVMLSLGVLAAGGFTALAQARRRPAAWGLAAVGLVCLEFLPAPYPISPPDTPAWYHELAREPGDFAILNLPMNWDRPRYLLYQTVHGKRLTSAYISRNDPSTLVERMAILQQFRHLGQDVIRQDLAAVAGTTFRYLNVRYLVADFYQMPGGEERERTLALLQEVVGKDTKPVYQDERLLAYRAPLDRRPAPVLILGPGWGALTPAGGLRAVEGEAELLFLAEEPAQVRLELWAYCPEGRVLEARRDGERLGRWETGPNGDPLVSDPIALAPGLTAVGLHTEGHGACWVSGMRLVPP
ncbi:MAG: hypothetical protein ACUVWW_00775 [Anaerolineae bacterium]